MTNLRDLLLVTSLLASSCTPLLIPVSPPVAPPSGVDIGFIEQQGERLTLKVVNTLAEPVIVDVGKVVLETPGNVRAARGAGRLLMLPPENTTVISVDFDLRGLRAGDLVSVLFERAVRSRRGPVAVPPLVLVAKRGSAAAHMN